VLCVTVPVNAGERVFRDLCGSGLVGQVGKERGNDCVTEGE
jgi:hypothetical protein